MENEIKKEYSKTQIGKILNMSGKLFASTLQYLQIKPSRLDQHAGKAAEYFSQKDFQRIESFVKSYTKIERYKLFKENLPGFGRANTEIKKQKRKETLSKKWGFVTVCRNIFGEENLFRQDLSLLIMYKYKQTLEDFLKVEDWEKLKTLKDFYNSLGVDFKERREKLLSFFPDIRFQKEVNKLARRKKQAKKMTEYWKDNVDAKQKLRNSIKNHKLQVEQSVDRTVWATREEAQNFLAKNESTTYSYYKLYGLRLQKKSNILFYNWEDLRYLKKTLNQRKQNVGQVHNAVSERLLRLNVNFDREKTFKDFGSRRFDFYIPSKKIAIEVQGNQHFSDLQFKTKLHDKQILVDRVESDLAKIEYCKTKGIDLIWITTNEDVSDFFENYLEKSNVDDQLQKWFHRGHLDVETYYKNNSFWKRFHSSKKNYNALM